MEHNLRLVASIARKYANTGDVLMTDLMQEGSLGLLRGLDKFDLNRGFKFSTYVHYWIWQAITRALGEQSRTVRLPTHVSSALSKIRKEMRLLQGSLGRKPTLAEIGAAVRLSPAKVQNLLTVGREIQSADADLSDGSGRSSSLLDMFSSGEDAIDVERLDSAQSLREDMDAVLSTLSTRERDVLRLRYGLHREPVAGQRNGSGMSIMEVARLYGLTVERVRQIELLALSKLRQCDCLHSHFLSSS